jgi:alpha-mannosidase
VSETRAEIQFGHVKRATHQNTSWDQARFETSMQRWVDMSEADFGAAFLTDSKYGYDAVEQTVRLTLLKGPTVPDPNADIGIHHFRYALMLHAGENDLNTVQKAAERFNAPIMTFGKVAACEPQDMQAGFSFAQCDNQNLTLETVKGAEQGGDIILRVYEHANRRTSAKITFGLPIRAVIETNLMEKNSSEPLKIDNNSIALSFRPFEIKTLRISILKD